MDSATTTSGGPIATTRSSPRVTCTRVPRHVLDVTTTEVPQRLTDLTAFAWRAGASDIHLATGETPRLRIGGSLIVGQHDDYPGAAKRIDAQEMEQMARFLAGSRWEEFARRGDLDCAATVDKQRYRVSLLGQTTGIGAALRLITEQIPSFDDLGLPKRILEFADLPHGLVLVSGPTGQGKSTTLASLVQHVSSNRSCHIITIEDPIEFIHTMGDNAKAFIRQREVGEHTEGFAEALRHALRQDPDVILVGEMRDPETIAVAVTAAETGHLVFSTLHVRDAVGVINRIIDSFEATQQPQVRAELSVALAGVVCQNLLPSAKETGKRVPVTEIMVATPAIRTLIREGKTHQIGSHIQSGIKDHGMRPYDLDLAIHVAAGEVSAQDALVMCRDPGNYRSYLASDIARVA